MRRWRCSRAGLLEAMFEAYVALLEELAASDAAGRRPTDR